MLDSLIAPFDWQTVVNDPWQGDFEGTLWIVLMGLFVSLSAGLVGNYLVLRRMALVGDAISHSILPGIALAFIITSSMAAPVMFIGAIIAGILTIITIELIHRKSRVKTDSAIGIVFTVFFSIGVILINLFASKVHLDAECVLYGEIGFIPFEDSLELFGQNLGPYPLIQMGLVTLFVSLLVLVFYKELLVTSFDTGLAKSLGIKVNVFHYGLMSVLAIVIVSAFEAVGVILVIAMLIFPGATAALWTDRFPKIIAMTFVFSIMYALFGFHLATWLECPIAGSMVLVAGMLFLLSWVFSPSRGLLQRFFRTVEIEELGQEEAKLS